MSTPAATASDPEVLTVVPEALKKLVRFIIRAFYDLEQHLMVDLLVHHACMREEDMMDLLKLEQKQFRAAVNTLKNDKLLKTRMLMETNSEGKTNKHLVYFINYSIFVNVVKYKLDHMLRKIETEERDATSRASFKCLPCAKTFTDLEVGELFDPYTGEMRCTFCRAEVEEEATAMPKGDSRSLIVKFNEQIEPIYNLLREVEDVKLSAEILNPEPAVIKTSKTSGAGSASRGPGQGGMWSGERRQVGYGFTENKVTVNLEEDGGASAAGGSGGAGGGAQPVKDRPVWMVESTIEGAQSESLLQEDSNQTAKDDQPMAAQENSDIMRTLLAHEKKASAPHIPGAPPSEDTSSSESDDDQMKPGPSQPGPAFVEEMEGSDDEDGDAVAMVTIGTARVAYHEVTEDMVRQMSAAEQEAYIKLGQEMYQDMYD